MTAWLAARFAGMGARLSFIIAGIGAILAAVWKIRHDGEVAGANRIRNLDLTRTLDVQRKMAAAPRVNSDAELVERLRRTGL